MICINNLFTTRPSWSNRLGWRDKERTWWDDADQNVTLGFSSLSVIDGEVGAVCYCTGNRKTRSRVFRTRGHKNNLGKPASPDSNPVIHYPSSIIRDRAHVNVDMGMPSRSGPGVGHGAHYGYPVFNLVLQFVCPYTEYGH
jgi:hypothetical protein